MTRQELLEVRTELFDAYVARQKLGEFDANAGAIVTMMKVMIILMDHTLEEMKKAKNVHGKAKSTAD